MKKNFVKYLFFILIFSLSYFILARFSLYLTFKGAIDTPAWLPAGFALSILLSKGNKYWPFIFLGGIFVEFYVSMSLGLNRGNAILLSFFTGWVNVFEALLGSWLIQFYLPEKAQFNSVKSNRILILSALISSALAALLGTILTCLFLNTWANFINRLGLWFLSDFVGILFIIGIFIFWPKEKPKASSKKKKIELIFFMSVYFIFFFFIAMTNYPIKFLSIPLLIWAMFSFGPFITFILITFTGLFFAFIHTSNVEMFAISQIRYLAIYQLFYGTISITFLLLSGILSERKIKELEIKKLSLAIRQSSNGVVITDINGIIEFVNPEFTKICGYSVSELIGKNPSILKSGDKTKEDYSELWNTIIAGKVWRGEFLNIRKDGTLYNEWASIFPLFDTENKITNFVAVKEDVTQKKMKEAELKAYRQHLEEMVLERTSELNKSREELLTLVDNLNDKTVELEIQKNRAESADRTKSAFLASMSHELRTPLNSIIGFTGILLQGMAGPLNDEQIKQLSMTKASAKHLLSLINDVLDISKIEAGELKVYSENLNLNNLIKSVQVLMAPLASKKGLAMEFVLFEQEIFFKSDEKRLKQILINLLANAIKFTEKGSIRLVCKNREDHIEIEVTDTGIGIAKEHFKQIFSAFSQIKTGLSHKHEGTGLGLSITKKLVEMLGGNITVDSVEGHGTTFIVVLPIK